MRRLPLRLRSHCRPAPANFVPYGLRPTGTNKLVVRVDSRHRTLDVPSVTVRKGGNYVGGWWNYAGILREVYLRKVDTLDFANVYVRPDLPCRTCTATVRIRAIVGNFDQLPANAEVTGKIAGQEIRWLRSELPEDLPLIVSGRAVNLLAKPIANVRTAADFSSVMGTMRELGVVPAANGTAAVQRA